MLVRTSMNRVTFLCFQGASVCRNGIYREAFYAPFLAADFSSSILPPESLCTPVFGFRKAFLFCFVCSWCLLKNGDERGGVGGGGTLVEGGLKNIRKKKKLPPVSCVLFFRRIVTVLFLLYSVCVVVCVAC